MRGTWRVFVAELYRLRGSRAAWLAAVLVSGLAVLRVGVWHLAESAARLAAAREGRVFLGLDEGRGWAPLVEGWRSGLVLGALLILIQGAFSIAGDRERGILRLAATRTAGRGALVLGRVLIGPVLVLSVLVSSGLGAWSAAAWWFDFGPLVEDGYPILGVEELRRELMIAVLAALAPLLAMHAFGLLVSVFTRGAVLAVVCASLFYLLFDLLKESLGKGYLWVFASYSPSLVDTSAMKEMVGVARGFSDAGFTEGVMRMNLVLPWVEVAGIVIVAVWGMGRRGV